MSLSRVAESEIDQNVFREVGKEWMLITAGTVEQYNTMTASWGTFGVLWGRNVAICFVRPTRHTFEFMERADHFTLSFFDSEHHDALMYCGTHSGRDVDKAVETGLTPIAVSTLDEGDARKGGDIPPDAVSFAEARLLFVCTKIYTDVFEAEHFVQKALDQEIYPKRDHHTMYIGEIVACFRR